MNRKERVVIGYKNNNTNLANPKMMSILGKNLQEEWMESSDVW